MTLRELRVSAETLARAGKQERVSGLERHERAIARFRSAYDHCRDLHDAQVIARSADSMISPRECGTIPKNKRQTIYSF